MDGPLSAREVAIEAVLEGAGHVYRVPPGEDGLSIWLQLLQERGAWLLHVMAGSGER